MGETRSGPPRVGSSFSPTSTRSVPADMPFHNAPFEFEGMLGNPVSYDVQAKLRRRRWLGYVDGEGGPMAVIKEVMWAICDNGVAAAQIMMHRFRFVRNAKPV